MPDARTEAEERWMLMGRFFPNPAQPAYHGWVALEGPKPEQNGVTVEVVPASELEAAEAQLSQARRALATLANPKGDEYEASAYVRRMAAYAREALATGDET